MIWEYVTAFDQNKVDDGLERQFNPKKSHGFYERRFGNLLMHEFSTWTDIGYTLLSFQLETDSLPISIVHSDIRVATDDDEWPAVDLFLVRYELDDRKRFVPKIELLNHGDTQVLRPYATVHPKFLRGLHMFPDSVGAIALKHLPGAYCGLGDRAETIPLFVAVRTSVGGVLWKKGTHTPVAVFHQPLKEVSLE